MSVNCSSSNAVLPSDTPYSSFVFSFMNQCFNSTFGFSMIMSTIVASLIFLLPVYIFILHLGFKQWWQQHPNATATSNFDLFTYHLVLVELLNILSAIFTCCGVRTNSSELLVAGIYLLILTFAGQMLFHILTCLDRYLAIVHPVTYRSMKGERWVRARKVVNASAWLFSILLTVISSVVDSYNSHFLIYFISAFELFLITAFSLSILWILIRPGPGEGARGRQHIDQSKLRAFHIVIAIMGVLVFRLCWSFISSCLVNSNHSNSTKCMSASFTYWINMPSSLIVPLLYLQRRVKQFCRKNKNESNPNV